MFGTIWMAEAPVPITATRLPFSGVSWSHREEWKIGPEKLSMPSIAGRRGSHSAPMPSTSTRAS